MEKSENLSPIQNATRRLLQIIQRANQLGVPLHEAAGPLGLAEDDEIQRLSKAMADHPDAMPYLQHATEFPMEHFRERFEKEGKGNPFLHLYMHAAVEGARLADERFRNAYQTLVAKAMKHAGEQEAKHSAQHALMWILSQMIWEGSHEGNETASRRIEERLQCAFVWEDVPREVRNIVRDQKPVHNF